MDIRKDVDVKKTAVAGTLESSDIMISIGPGSGKLEIDLSSTVDIYYHDQILRVIQETLSDLRVRSAEVKAVDHGALDCTVRARVTTAVRRAVEEAL